MKLVSGNIFYKHGEKVDEELKIDSSAYSNAMDEIVAPLQQGMWWNNFHLLYDHIDELTRKL